MLQNEATDLRVRRTRKLLRDALVALMEQSGYEAININQLCERAMVNRATFYRHYRDKFDLLTHCMDDVFDDLIRQTTPPPRRAEEVDLEAGYQNIVLLFNHVAEHAAFYRLMLGQSGSGAFRAQVERYLQQVLHQRWEQARHVYVQPPRLAPPMIIAYQSAAFIGLVQWWTEQGCRETPADMARNALKLLLYGVGWAFGMDIPDNHQ
jgi:AcrR family transcriptional regulator